MMRLAPALLLAASLPAAAATLALSGGTIYTGPGAAPIADGLVLVRDGKIAAAGKRTSIAVPKDATVLDCTGRTVTAGFQNSHIHFTEPKWQDAAEKPAAVLQRQLTEMLTRFGFTTIVDTGSAYANTAALRKRIEAGEIAGPRILLSGATLFPAGGIPFYLREDTPPELLKTLPQPTTPGEARDIVSRSFNQPAEILKLFTGSLVERERVQPMRLEIVRVAVAEAHRRGKLVFAHPSNIEGLEVALDGGVDVLAHSTSAEGFWPPALIARMRKAQMSLIPTLQLWQFESKRSGNSPDRALNWARERGRNVLAYRKAGGQILFGTDVGYMTEYDPTIEYSLLRESGLSPVHILAALTVEPARRFQEAAVRGRIAPGLAADLVVLSADPMSDPRNFARVRYTIRQGTVIYRNETPAR